MQKLSKRQLERYFCSTFLKEIGEAGQLKLLSSKVLVIGAGGLASSSLLYLSTIGVGTIGIIDDDKVSLTNLPRQIIYDESDTNKNKVIAVKEVLEKKNPDVKVITYKERLTEKNAQNIIKNYDIVLDCVDNFDTKFVINDACLALKIPFVSAGVSGFNGQILFVSKESKSDFKSLFSILPLNVSKEIRDKDRGVYPLAVGIVSNIQCSEAIKYLLGLGSSLIDEIMVVDTLNLRFEKYKI